MRRAGSSSSRRLGVRCSVGLTIGFAVPMRHAAGNARVFHRNCSSWRRRHTSSPTSTSAIEDANTAAAKLLRRPLDQLIGKPLTMFVEPGERAIFHRMVTESLIALKQLVQPLTLQPVSGEEVEVLYSACVVHDARGALAPSTGCLSRDSRGGRENSYRAICGFPSGGYIVVISKNKTGVTMSKRTVNSKRGTRPGIETRNRQGRRCPAVDSSESSYLGPRCRTAGRNQQRAALHPRGARGTARAIHQRVRREDLHAPELRVDGREPPG